MIKSTLRIMQNSQIVILYNEQEWEEQAMSHIVVTVDNILEDRLNKCIQ